jgi:hypothetical protein
MLKDAVVGSRHDSCVVIPEVSTDTSVIFHINRTKPS